MNLISVFIHHPVKVSVGVLLTVLFGLVAMWRMPMQLTPEVETPTISIETRWPGASPQEVEMEIIQEQEEQLKSVEGLVKMSSECRNHGGSITLEFQVGTDIQQALLKVNTRLQQVREYPEDALEPVISTSGVNDRPIAWFILSALMPSDEEISKHQQELQATHPELAPMLDRVKEATNAGLREWRLRRLVKEHPELAPLLPPPVELGNLRKFAQDFLEPEFERAPGVSNANVMGGREPEMQVVVDPERLSSCHLSIADLRTTLCNHNVDISGGDVWEGKRRWTVRTLGRYENTEQIADTLLSIRDGKPIYIRDVAEVRRGFKKPDGFVCRYGQECIALNAVREPGANVLNVMHELRARTTQLNEGLLRNRGLTLTQVYDETEYIYSAVGLVNENIMLGGALTVIVLMLFLHLGARTLFLSPLIAITAVMAVAVSPWFFLISLGLMIVAGAWYARGALVVALAIPISIAGTFLVLNMLGRSLNVISLAGLAFAVGMLVDNAVVVLENTYRHCQEGRRPFEAALRGAQEVWGAVVASTLTTLYVFIPILFIREEAGQLFADIALAISAAVGLSLLVSITVVPPAAARILSGARPAEEAQGYDSSWLSALVLRPNQFFVAAVVGINAWINRTLFRRLAMVFSGVAFCVIATWVILPKIEYLPNGNRNLVFATIIPPPGYNLDELQDIGRQAEEELRPYWDIEPNSVAAKSLRAPAIADLFYVARGRNVMVGLRAHDATKASGLVQLLTLGDPGDPVLGEDERERNPQGPYKGRGRLAGKFPGTLAFAFQASLFSQGLNSGRAIEIDISGDNLEDLIAVGARVMGQVQAEFAPPPSGNAAVAGKDPSAAGPAAGGPRIQVRPIPSLDLASPEVQLTPTHAARELGLDESSLGYAVDALVDGAYASDFFQGGTKIDLVILGSEKFAQHTHDLQHLPVAAPNGQLVEMGTLARIQLSSGPEQVNHRERQRAITIQATPSVEVAMEDAMAIIDSRIVEPLRREGALSGKFRVSVSGAADKLVKTWDDLKWNLLLALLVTYLLMAGLFESWSHPLVIILSVPLGALGGVAALRMLSMYLVALGEPPQNLDVLTMLGFIILIGTVVNNAILVVHQAINHMREDGLSENDAVLESVRTRMRPMFMTTITTVFGLLPLVLFPGAGSELYRGLGAVLLGGLLFSTLIILILIPAAFTLMVESSRYMRMLLLGPETESPLRRMPEGGSHPGSRNEPIPLGARTGAAIGPAVGNGTGHGDDATADDSEDAIVSRPK